MASSVSSLGSLGASFHMFFGFATLHFAFLSMDEILILRCVQLTRWKKWALCDDYFIATFLGMYNVLVASILSGIRMFLGEFEANTYWQFFAGEGSKPSTYLTDNAKF